MIKKSIRELQKSREELSKIRISVRTIQRIETGKEPKGHTLRVIAQALKVKGKELLSM
jgi:transcriptional regulator with XRE-family HTH domain